MKQAEMIFDQSGDPKVPENMETPKNHQNKGTALEKLAEIAGRVCYDSMGKGRSSEDWHKHILDVDHLSVYEHCPIIISIPMEQFEEIAEIGLLFLTLVGRPGITVNKYYPQINKMGFLRICFNPRCVLDWRKLPLKEDNYSDKLHSTMAHALRDVAPQVVQKYDAWGSKIYEYEHVVPYFPTEKWISFWLMGSRGWSHEQVRHGDFTAISQRSTRYVNESKSVWHCHPLILRYIDEHLSDLHSDLQIQLKCEEVYRKIIAALEPWLIERGVDKFTARKQSRGAARGFLGNALSTQMIFSANVWQWLSMLKQRMSLHADAEIRLIFNQIYEGLLDSKWGDFFGNTDVMPSPDGMGLVLTETE